MFFFLISEEVIIFKVAISSFPDVKVKVPNIVLESIGASKFGYIDICVSMLLVELLLIDIIGFSSKFKDSSGKEEDLLIYIFSILFCSQLSKALFAISFAFIYV